MDFRTFVETQLPDTYAKDLDFMKLADSLRALMIQLFGKKKIRETIPRQFVFTMGTRWGRLNLGRGERNIMLPARPGIAIEFSWDYSRKTGEIPDTLAGKTVQPGSMKFAHALKELSRWALQNKVRISYTAEPDRLNYYGKVLSKMGFLKKELPLDKHSGYQGGSYYPPES